MYVCSNCSKVTQPRVPQHKITSYKEVTHPVRYKLVLDHKGQPVYRWHRKMFPEWKGGWDRDGHLLEVIDFGGVGKQIEKEVIVCPNCHR